MIFHVLSVYDIKSQSFHPPFYSVSVDVGLRNVTAAVSDAAGLLGQFPGDFKVYYIGTFNDETAVFDLSFPPEMLCVCDSLIQKGVKDAL